MVVEDMPAVDPQRSLLLVGNHISWWDGFWPLYLNRRYWHKHYHVMMLETQLRARPFMRQGGAFSILPGSRTVLDSLAYAGQLLEDPTKLVLMFPQGKIHSLYQPEIRFARGAERLWQPERSQLFFLAAFPEYLSHPRPTLFYYVEEANADQALAEGYAAFYRRVRARQAARTS